MELARDVRTFATRALGFGRSHPGKLGVPGRPEARQDASKASLEARDEQSVRASGTLRGF